MASARVSVVMPIFNAARFLDEAIASVLTQTYSEWELLLVDDGSTDGSTAQARAYASRYPDQVRYLEHPGHQNRGISATLNVGIRQATGTYVALLDADDVWFPRKLEHQVATIDAHPMAVMLYGPSQHWYGWTGRNEDRRRDFIERLGVVTDTLLEPPTLLLSLIVRRQAPVPCPCSVLFRRQALSTIGGFEELLPNSHSDQSLYAKVFLKAPVVASSLCCARYRRHPDSAISVMKRSGQAEGDRLMLFEWLEAYLSAQRMEGTEVWQALQDELWPLRHPARARVGRVARRLAREPVNEVRSLATRAGTSVFPPLVRDWLRRRRRDEVYRPSIGRIRFGDLRRLTPISDSWGNDRGLPVDRYYIEDFLAGHADDIRGRVLEIGDDAYTRRFGGPAVNESDVLHAVEGNPKATIVADLAHADHIPSDRFDCIILTQTLQYIYDVRAAITTLHRILKPAGVLLATFPGITKLGDREWGGSPYWSFTALSADRLFKPLFPAANVTIEARGNVLAAVAFLHGVATEELRSEELNARDPAYEVSITVRAVKAGSRDA